MKKMDHNLFRFFVSLVSLLFILFWSVNSVFAQKVVFEEINNSPVNDDVNVLLKNCFEEYPVLKIGYDASYFPYCYSGSDGNLDGFLDDYLDLFFRNLDVGRILKIEPVAFNDSLAMISALGEGKVDVIFPIINEKSLLDKYEIESSSDVLKLAINVIYKGNFDIDVFNRIAVTERFLPQVYAAKYFPESELVHVKSRDDCVKAVLNEDASCSIMSTGRMAGLLSESENAALKSLCLNNSVSMSFGFRPTDTNLISLFNKGISLIDGLEVFNILYTNSDYVKELSVGDFFRGHIYLVLIISVTIITLLILCFVFYSKGVKSARKKIQESFFQVQKTNKEIEAAKALAESANAAKSRFLFNMSHDIRTPMNAIIGFTDLLEKNQDDVEKRADYLKKIRDSSSVLLSIINNVLEMARIEKGNVELNEQPNDILQLNDTLVSVFKDQMEEKGIAFKKNFYINHRYVYFDQIKLKEVLLNILSNAFKYTKPGGFVSMEMKELPGDKEGWVYFETTISDTGIGMSPDFLPHLYEEFFRERNSTEAKVEGTGLGMSIVKRLLDLMNGEIVVKSELGKGSSFKITIPHRIANQEDVEDCVPVVNSKGKFIGKRILLAEDNDLNAEIAVEVLREFGLEVERVENGFQCINRVDQAPDYYYDLILMDIQMPIMNGYDATKIVRDMLNETKSKIPIIAMTANAFEEDRKNAIECGMNQHLSKPIDPQQLAKVLSTYLK